MGNLSSTKEQMRDARVVGWLASCLEDLRHGIVLLGRDAGASALIVLVLALGIGGNAAIFTLLKAAFLDPLPYRDAKRLVTIRENNGWDPSDSEFLEMRARTRTLGQMAFAEHRDMQLSGTGEPVRVYAARVTASFLPLLGAGVELGRMLVPEDNQAGRTPVAVLTHAFWRSRLGADPAVRGRTLRLDGKSAVIVGVLAPGFHFDYPALRIPEPVDIYVSYPMERQANVLASRSGRGTPVLVLARLREGVTFTQAVGDIRSIARVLTHEYPSAFPNPQHDPSRFTFEMFPLRDAIVGTQRGLLWLLLGGVGVLLLIACANTAQLLLARSLRRGREVAIRAALGASRTRLIRQFLLEGLVLAVCGGMAGVLAAGSIARLLVAVLPVRSPLLEPAHSDARVIAFTLTLSLFSAILFSIIPAIKGSRWTPGPALTARLTTGEGNKWRHVMTALEAALSVFLLCAAGLVAQNLWTLISTPAGFDPKHVLVMRLKLPSSRPQNSIDPKAGRVFQEYLQKIEAIPGVESAATVTGPPLRPARTGNSELVGVTDGTGALKIVWSDNHLISPDYFRTLRIPLLAGRAFRADDTGPRVKVAIVNEEFARRFGLGADVVGRQIYEPGEPIRIVGMAGNVRTRGLEIDPYPEVYLSSLQLDWVNVYLVVRSVLPPAQLVKQVKAAIKSSNSDQAVFGVQTMDEMMAESVSQPRFEVFVIGSFALLAVAMAAAGMYSVISCLVSQRTGEIAIRIALGASRCAIIRTVMGKTTVWVVAGLAVGLALGLATRNTLRSLSGTAVRGAPWMYGAVVLFFFVVTMAAAYGPLRQANRLDPAEALRSE
ncbi:MAG: ABC transporter permease [Acidobacteriaceae bacterium]|nr:ABC transporter permease [Acidobacteriaceae bacterium]